MKKVFGLFLSLIVIMGLWSCNQKELDNLQSQIDELKSVQIASINAQIAGIKSSIESMEKMDEQMKTRIDELTKKQQELESTDTEQAKEIVALKESLIEKEASLSKRIDELKSYVEKELKNQKDWVNATFCTLAQYHSTCDEIAALKLAISAQEATLRALISTTESSIKTWVNEHLTEYYTIAEMDAKIAQLSKSIADGDAAQAAELEKLRAELNVARTDIKTAYEKAIEDAITTSEGKINEKIANDIKSATDALQSQIDELNTKIADIEKRLGLVEASLEKILSQVQSIVVVPTYSDGSVGIKESEDTEIRFEVSPRSASVALAKQGPEVFSLDAVSTQTKASMFVANFPIKSVSDNGECLVVRLDAAKMDMEAVYANPSMNARLRIDDGNSSMTTGYFAIHIPPCVLVMKENPNDFGIRAVSKSGASVAFCGVDKIATINGEVYDFDANKVGDLNMEGVPAGAIMLNINNDVNGVVIANYCFDKEGKPTTIGDNINYGYVFAWKDGFDKAPIIVYTNVNIEPNNRGNSFGYMNCGGDVNGDFLLCTIFASRSAATSHHVFEFHNGDFSMFKWHHFKTGYASNDGNWGQIIAPASGNVNGTFFIGDSMGDNKGYHVYTRQGMENTGEDVALHGTTLTTVPGVQCIGIPEGNAQYGNYSTGNIKAFMLNGTPYVITASAGWPEVYITIQSNNPADEENHYLLKTQYFNASQVIPSAAYVYDAVKNEGQVLLLGGLEVIARYRIKHLSK